MNESRRWIGKGRERGGESGEEYIDIAKGDACPHFARAGCAAVRLRNAVRGGLCESLGRARTGHANRRPFCAGAASGLRQQCLGF
jgi:hypothetical protein